MIVTVRDNRGNGQPLFDALERAGHKLQNVGVGDVLFTDADPSHLEPYRTLCDAHDKVLVHPHGAGLIVPDQKHPHTLGQFVTGSGQADVLRAIGYTGKLVILGWHFSPIYPFRPRRDVHGLRVLLAPTHAMGDGSYDAALPSINARLHDWLAAMPLDLTVRYVHGWEPLGIARHPHTTYVQGTGMLKDALNALRGVDLVIGGTWTFPTLAVALGIPTIMYGAGALDRRYSHIVRFPYEADACMRSVDLAEMMQRACTDDGPIEQWRGRFVGWPWEPERFVKDFETAVREW